MSEFKELNKAIGNRIRELRHTHGMTQEILAEKLDVSIKHMSAVERGQSSLSIEKLILTARQLNTSLDYLILGKSSVDLTNYTPEYVIDVMRSNDKEELELLTEYLNLYAALRRPLK